MPMVGEKCMHAKKASVGQNEAVREGVVPAVTTTVECYVQVVEVFVPILRAGWDLGAARIRQVSLLVWAEKVPFVGQVVIEDVD